MVYAIFLDINLQGSIDDKYLGSSPGKVYTLDAISASAFSLDSRCDQISGLPCTMSVPSLKRIHYTDCSSLAKLVASVTLAAAAAAATH